VRHHSRLVYSLLKCTDAAMHCVYVCILLLCVYIIMSIYVYLYLGVLFAFGVCIYVSLVILYVCGMCIFL
jgi:hypothetical protein